MLNSRKIKPAKLCYKHIGGKLGELLLDLFVTKKWIARRDTGEKLFYITDLGIDQFEKLGIDLNLIKSEMI